MVGKKNVSTGGGGAEGEGGSKKNILQKAVRGIGTLMTHLLGVIE
jgi:hypothetical protein